MGYRLLFSLILILSANHCVESIYEVIRVRKGPEPTLNCRNLDIPDNWNATWYRNGVQVDESMVGSPMLPGVKEINGREIIFLTPAEPAHESRWACSSGINNNRSEERIYYVDVKTFNVNETFKRREYINFQIGLDSIGPETRERANVSITMTDDETFFFSATVNLSSSINNTLDFSSPAGNLSLDLFNFTISLQLLPFVTEFNWDCDFRFTVTPHNFIYSKIRIRINDTLTACLPEGDTKSVFAVKFLDQDCSSQEVCESYELTCYSDHNGTLTLTSTSDVSEEQVRTLFAGEVEITRVQQPTTDTPSMHMLTLGGGVGGGGGLIVITIVVIAVIVVVVWKRKHRGSVHVPAATMAEEGRASSATPHVTTCFHSERNSERHDTVPQSCECGRSPANAHHPVQQQQPTSPVVANVYGSNGATCSGHHCHHSCTPIHMCHPQLHSHFFIASAAPSSQKFYATSALHHDCANVSLPNLQCNHDLCDPNRPDHRNHVSLQQPTQYQQHHQHQPCQQGATQVAMHQSSWQQGFSQPREIAAVTQAKRDSVS